MPCENESSWRLLFGIALSHGDALKTGRLSYDGWMVFLSSAQLIGTTTGVFPVLLDQLWQRQALSEGVELENAATLAGSRGFASASTSTSAPPSSLFAGRSGCATPAVAADPLSLLPEQIHAGESVGFSGFVDMMNVICVRIFQTQRCCELREEHESHDSHSRVDAALLALRQSAEDQVFLTESVQYAAAAFLRPFIAKSTIHASSQMRLHPARNGWAPHVNRLVSHVVGSLLHSIFLPLFRRYAPTGRLSKMGYGSLVQDLLPNREATEETCALAIFDHGGFPDIRPFLQPLQPLLGALPDLARVVSDRTLGFTDFIEALLMLSVVVYADESRHPAQCPITAKVWSFVEDFLCAGMFGGAAMCCDPYTTGCYAAVPPGLAAVYPLVVPLAEYPSLFAEFFNVEETQTASSSSPLVPSVARGYSENGMTSTSPFLTEVVAERQSIPQQKNKSDGGGCNCTSDVAVRAAAPFFSSEWSLLERNGDVSLFGCNFAPGNVRVMIDGTAVETRGTGCPGLLQVFLPQHLQQPLLYGCAVEAVVEPNSEAANVEGVSLQLHFIPFRSFPVELAMPEHVDAGRSPLNGTCGSSSQYRPWGCEDVVLTDTPVVQRLPAHLLAALHTFFLSKANVTSVGAPESAPPRAPLSVLCDVCCQLQWCATSAKGREELPSLCTQTWAQYRETQRVLHSATRFSRRTIGLKAPLAAAAESERPTSELTFVELVGCLAALLFQLQGGKLDDIPDVPRRLQLAVASIPNLSASEAPPSAVQSAETAPQDIRCIPHNAFRDVPFAMAISRKKRQSVEATERRVALLESLREHHASQVTSSLTLPPLPEYRPQAMPLVSQYGTVNPTEDFFAVMREGAETIKYHFLQQELAIPELED